MSFCDHKNQFCISKREIEKVQKGNIGKEASTQTKSEKQRTKVLMHDGIAQTDEYEDFMERFRVEMEGFSQVTRHELIGLLKQANKEDESRMERKRDAKKKIADSRRLLKQVQTLEAQVYSTHLKLVEIGDILIDSFACTKVVRCQPKFTAGFGEYKLNRALAIIEKNGLNRK